MSTLFPAAPMRQAEKEVSKPCGLPKSSPAAFRHPGRLNKLWAPVPDGSSYPPPFAGFPPDAGRHRNHPQAGPPECFPRVPPGIAEPAGALLPPVPCISRKAGYRSPCVRPGSEPAQQISVDVNDRASSPFREQGHVRLDNQREFIPFQAHPVAHGVHHVETLCGNFITLGLGPVRSFPSITWFRRLTSTGTVSPGRTPTMAARMEYIPSTGFPFSFISTSPAVNPLRCARFRLPRRLS